MTASTADDSQKEVLMPSFLKALFISSDETIFDDAETNRNFSNFGLKSMTNSAEAALSAPDALR